MSLHASANGFCEGGLDRRDIRIACNVIEIEVCARDVRRYFARLEQAAKAS